MPNRSRQWRTRGVARRRHLLLGFIGRRVFSTIAMAICAGLVGRGVSFDDASRRISRVF